MPTHHELGELAIVAMAALLCGIGLTRIRQPAIVGYILAGVILGPSGFALVENMNIVSLLAELGVLLLLFIIGMKLSLRSFRSVWRLSLLATLLQVGICTVLTLALSNIFDWPIALSCLLGFVVSLSSTAVAIKMLEDIGELRSETGRVVIGVLIAQDLAVVPMLLLLDGLAGEEGFSYSSIPIIFGAIGFLVLLVWWLSRRTKIRLPLGKLTLNNLDIAPLTALSYCFALAALAAFLGLTAAYGAFIAGLFIGSTTARRQMIQVTEPIQAVLVMVFFLSIGLLIDLQYIWSNIGTVLVLLFLILIVKSAMNIWVFRLVGEPWPRAFLSGVILSQVGEFSFVIASAGVTMNLIGLEGSRLIISVIALSLIVSPIWLLTARRLQDLTSRGISDFNGLILRLYADEARALSDGSGKATKETLEITQKIKRGIIKIARLIS
tara:strand:- start:16806 stop:18119 length:1314 start_codon:yes stop_codon:yes gene_type:complete